MIVYKLDNFDIPAGQGLVADHDLKCNDPDPAEISLLKKLTHDP